MRWMGMGEGRRGIKGKKMAAGGLKARRDPVLEIGQIPRIYPVQQSFQRKRARSAGMQNQLQRAPSCWEAPPPRNIIFLIAAMRRRSSRRTWSDSRALRMPGQKAISPARSAILRKSKVSHQQAGELG